MSLVYNIDFELAAAAYMIVVYVFLLIQYSDKLEANIKFKRLTFFVLIADIMDVFTAITISYSSIVPVWINTLLNTAYFAMNAVLSYQFMDYSVSYVYTGDKRKKVLRFNQILLTLYICSLIINMFTGFIFSFDQTGGYIHEVLYIIVYIIPVYYILFSAGILFRNYKSFRIKQKVAIGFYIVLSSAGPILQLLFFPDVLLSLFTASLGILIIMFSLETPDYHMLMKTMEELEKTKEEAEQAREKAEAANQTKNEFLANMSHEIRTPINALLGYNEMIMRETQESRTAEYTMNIQAAGRTLLSLINDILDFANVDKGKLKLQNAPYSVLSLLQDMIIYAEYSTEKKNLELRLSIDEKLPQELSGDVVRLMQIFNNLISNAIKYTQEGFVEVVIEWQAIDEQQGKMSVRIKDSGIGMKAEDVKKISESFVRFDKRKNYNIQGLGLGLPIVTRLLDLMDGRLEVESQYEKGSTFSFHIKQEIVNAAPIGKVERGNEKNLIWQFREGDKFTAPDARILAVDDNEMNLDLLKRILKETQVSVDTAFNGEKALKLLEENQYDLIFLDHMMPVLDGVETLKEIKKRNLCPGVPIIVLTANAVAGEKEAYLAAGFDAYLSKPIVGKQLEEVVKKYLPDNLIIEENVTIDSADKMVVEQNEKEKSFLERLSFLDTETGMGYCCNSEEFYKEMLTVYLNTEKRDAICEFYDKGDWENYRIEVHALKSTSLSIGAIQLSEQAKQLEMAAKEGDIAYIEENHEDAMEEYKEILSQLDNVINEKEEEIEPVSEEQEDLPHILVVDDNAMNLRIAGKMLEEKFKVSSAKSGKEALAFLKREIPDLILLDLHMPDMSGFEVIRRLKSKEEYSEIPVIFLTADDEREVEVRGFQEGALDFITKPFIADIMIQRINRILQLDRLQKDLQKEVFKQTRKAEVRRRKAERLTLQVMKTLAGTIDAKDKYTNGHSVRVAEYSRELARRLGKSEREQEDIYYMGLLHDIGKIGIPDEIINKSTKLTDEEYALIKSHPVIGADILKNLSEIPGIDTGARWHHERYDGSGYPDGLKGEEIPEVARIIGVADAYDAMASKRSYRDVLPQEVVRAEIEKGKGTQFDPYFVDKMLEMIDEDTEYQMREK